MSVESCGLDIYIIMVNTEMIFKVTRLNNKGYLQKLIAKILNGEKLNAFHLRSGKKQE